MNNLSDEERKAIDYLQLCYDLSTITNESLSKLGIVLNLIEKQSKEIEELKKKNQNVSDRIEYYLVGNMRLDDFDFRNEELRKLEKMLEDK